MMSCRFSDNKAGMEGLDKERIEGIISENTSHQFVNHEKKKTQRIESRMAQIHHALANITEEQIRQTELELDVQISEMEQMRNFAKVKVHIDMDAFFAAVECRDDPSLRAVPMAVGSDSMLSTSNYIARKFGVRSAMPGFIARKLCPSLKIVSGSFRKYHKESSIIRKIFEKYDPGVNMGSLDEAYLDITEYIATNKFPVSRKRIRYTGPCVCRLPLLVDGYDNAERTVETCQKCKKERTTVIDFVEFGPDIESTVRQIRFEVEQATGLTCSAGIANNSMLAKICSDLNKPNGQYFLPAVREEIVAFMRPLPTRKVPGIGPVSEAMLKALGVHTCGDLYDKRANIRLVFSRHSADWFLRISLGVSGGELVEDNEENRDDDGNPKSTSIERTFTSTRNLNELIAIARSLCADLVNSLPRSGIAGGRAATLKVKFANFDCITRCKSVNFLIKTVDTFFPIVESLLWREVKEKDTAVRLLGVRLSHLEFAESAREKGVQSSLLNFVRRPQKRGNDYPSPLIELDSSDDEENVANRSDPLGTSMAEISGKDAKSTSPPIVQNEEEEYPTNCEERVSTLSQQGVRSPCADEDIIFVDAIIPGQPRKSSDGKMKERIERKKAHKEQKRAKETNRKRRSTDLKSKQKQMGMRDLHSYFVKT